MGIAGDILKEADLFKLVAKETLQRTFNFDTAKIKTFEENFVIILNGHIFDLVQKHKAEFDEQGNGKMHREKFAPLSDI